MKTENPWFGFLFREWLLFASIAGLASTSIYLRRLPVPSPSEVNVLLLLWCLFVTVKGLENSGLMLRLSRYLDKGRLIPFKLVAATAILSMVVTNDAALIVIVPVTLSLNTSRKDILVILEALAANAGSALTPFGNPQNLFIYWFYGVHPADFVTCIAPFTSFFLAVLLVASLFIKTRNSAGGRPQIPAIARSGYIYGGLFLIVVLCVLRVLPAAVALLVPAFALALDRKALRVDYGLLVTLLCFCILTGNIRVLLASGIMHSGHVFLLSALSSQLISNVPAALLFSRFTTHWKVLLWGTNVGGFGSLVASMANLRSPTRSSSPTWTAPEAERSQSSS
ncbi:MAG: citrate transporter [Planctomycetes bacterium]|nr:citrate transporter [Planctomycetota bacterium]